MNSIRVSLLHVLQRLLAPSPRNRVSVRGGPTLTLEVTASENGACTTHAFASSAVSVHLEDRVVSISSRIPATGERSADWSFEADSPEYAKAIYRQVGRALAGRPGVWARVKPAAIGLLVGIAVVLLITPTAPTVTSAVAAPAPSAQAATPGVRTPAATPGVVPPDAHASVDEQKMVAALKGSVRLPGKGAEYFVFSDPNCPYCRELDRSIGKATSGQPVVLPLGYKPRSREISAAVLCAADPAKAWAAAVAGQAVTDKPCDAGYAMVDANMRAFEALRLSSTPTMITPKGVFVTGAASPSELQALLER